MNDSTIALLVSLGVTAIGLIGLVYYLAYRSVRKSKEPSPKLVKSFWDDEELTDEIVRSRRLQSTTDAAEWTEEFMALFGNDRTPDWGTMVGWFANAIEVGRTAGHQQAEDEVNAARDHIVDVVTGASGGRRKLRVATSVWLPQTANGHDLYIDGEHFPWHVLPAPQIRYDDEWDAHIIELELIVAPKWGAEVPRQ